MKIAMLAISLTLLAACSTFPESVKGRSAQGASATDRPTATSPYPAVTDKGLF